MSPVTTPFSFHSTASGITEGIDLTGRRAIVTGGASGIGIETARALAGAGASVTLAVRRPEAAEAVAAELRQSTGNDAIDVAALDLADLRSVKASCLLIPSLVGAKGKRKGAPLDGDMAKKSWISVMFAAPAVPPNRSALKNPGMTLAMKRIVDRSAV